MGLSSVLIEILGFFKFLWTLFTVGFPEPIRLVNQPSSTKPFRLLHLPSLAHDVIFSEMSTEELYHLSKCSRRSRYAVKMFTRRQKYYLNIATGKSFCHLQISNRFCIETMYDIWREDIIQPVDGNSLTTYSTDFWATTKEEITYFFNVFTKKVHCLNFYDTTNVTRMTELLKSATPLPVDWVWYNSSEIDDHLYKYVLREFKDAEELSIDASPSADFRFDDMQPFAGEYVTIKDADWLTVDNLTRCFMNVKKVRLGFDSNKCLNVLVFDQFLNAWRNGLIVGKLDLECGCITLDLQSILKNVPKTKVKRVEVGNKKTLFDDGKCFLIRQEESGMEAIVYLSHSVGFTTHFRLLRDDESD